MAQKTRYRAGKRKYMEEDSTNQLFLRGEEKHPGREGRLRTGQDSRKNHRRRAEDGIRGIRQADEFRPASTKWRREKFRQ